MNDQPTKRGMRVRVSTEMLNDSLINAYTSGPGGFLGMVGRRATPEEIAATNARLKEREAAEEAMVAELAAHTDVATTAILGLHTKESHEYGFSTCTGCDRGSYAEDDPDWPCRTILALATAHHITIPEHLT